MKRYFSFLLLLCLFFRAPAQDKPIPNKTKSTAALEIGKGGLQIGDQVPNVTITGLSGFRVNNKPVSKLPLSHFRGKLLIISFWATWCAPCRAMMPVEDSLQKVFGDRITILPVTYQPEVVAAPVLSAMRKVHDLKLPGVTGDTVLHRLFPHHALPHYVWVDAKGIIRAITEEKEVTAEKIRAMLSGTGTLAQKKDIVQPYDGMLPLLAGSNGGDGAGLKYHALLSSYIPGLEAGMTVTKFDSSSGQRFNVRNVPFVWICRLAFADKGRWFQDSRIAVLSKDSARLNSHLSGQAYMDWLAQGNGWCYELLVPPSLSLQAFPLIQTDLKRLFPAYEVTVETRKTKCLALVRTSGSDKLATKGGEVLVDIDPYKARLRNSTLTQLMKRLDHQYLQNSPLPVVDQTGYTGRVDLSVDGRLSDVPTLNKALAVYDLAFEEKEAAVEMLVIRDARQP
ncbi:redoxin domain-containing protein [Mucilaginibacter gynuensis]|uniref:Redoxin domain-containing protein n=1 Tax=Mucilaginibacter gynuensis TaxID=1302236 RepID=A0ABP8GLN5_9SPHI